MIKLPREYQEGIVIGHHEKGEFLTKKECLMAVGILIDYLSKNGYEIELNIKKMKTYVISFHYITQSNGILHTSYEVEANDEFEAQTKAMKLSKEFIADHNSNNIGDGIRTVSKIQFSK